MSLILYTEWGDEASLLYYLTENFEGPAFSETREKVCSWNKEFKITIDEINPKESA